MKAGRCKRCGGLVVFDTPARARGALERMLDRYHVRQTAAAACEKLGDRERAAAERAAAGEALAAGVAGVIRALHGLCFDVYDCEERRRCLPAEEETE